MADFYRHMLRKNAIDIRRHCGEERVSSRVNYGEVVSSRKALRSIGTGTPKSLGCDRRMGCAVEPQTTSRTVRPRPFRGDRLRRRSSPTSRSLGTSDALFGRDRLCEVESSPTALIEGEWLVAMFVDTDDDFTRYESADRSRSNSATKRRTCSRRGRMAGCTRIKFEDNSSLKRSSSALRRWAGSLAVDLNTTRGVEKGVYSLEGAASAIAQLRDYCGISR